MTLDVIQKRYRISDVLTAGINAEIQLDDILRHRSERPNEHLDGWTRFRQLAWERMNLTEKVTTESVEKHLWLGRILGDNQGYESLEWNDCIEQKHKLLGFIANHHLDNLFIANVTYAIERQPREGNLGESIHAGSILHLPKTDYELVEPTLLRRPAAA